ncbi:MAG: zinc ribbon domain-containing protein [Clostridia bacterium]|nr:zinc ribbon domain-containing protein [Clostridia bacterium]
MSNKIQKGKKSLITLGIIMLVLTAICIVGAVLCTIAAVTNEKWWLIAIAAILYIIGILGIIVGIVFVWTGCSLKATTGNLREGNIALEGGTINATLCPNCGAKLNPDDKFCPACTKPTSKIKICKSCKAQNEREAKVCTKCGQPL